MWAKCIIKITMRLVTFRIGNQPARPGALADGGRTVVQLAAPSVLAIAEGGQDALERAAETLRRPPREALFPLADVTLLAPIPQPPQMRDFLCFEKHLQQAFAAVARLRGTEARIPKIWYERPIFYHPNRFNVCGTGADVPWPRYSERMDFELEFGCYIGKPGKDIPKERAREHIFGYTIFNDFSARDEQTLEMMGQLGPGKGKDFDNSNVMGPCLVTADELADPYNLEMRVSVNGEEWGRGNSRDMHWKFEDCIAHVSRSETLHAGEFFGSGTVGDGCGLEHMKFLEPGDTVELEVESIGTLRNRVVR
jgi:2-keto-4-pentenoate hydratase/2-oxohepta-3-ene-1,7-dioic acid hydratase in catechol pathway